MTRARSLVGLSNQRCGSLKGDQPVSKLPAHYLPSRSDRQCLRGLSPVSGAAGRPAYPAMIFRSSRD